MKILPSLMALSMLVACGEMATLPPESGIGAKPVLPPPHPTFIPTIKIAAAKGWSANTAPQPAAGFVVRPFARNLQHPRWLYVLPNGDVLVAETDAPSKPEDSKGLRGKLMNFFMRRAGSGVPSANRILRLRDADGDGRAETREVFLQGLNSPLGMALCGKDFYVANTDALVRYVYAHGVVQGQGEQVAELPAGPINHHWTKNVVASTDCRHLYVAVGSNSNVAENGMVNEQERAAILQVDAGSGKSRIYASGLRNPVGLAWQPQSGALWAAVNERDEIGSDLVPDYFTEVKDGGFYGWPYSYYGPHVDERVKPQRADLVQRAIAPDYALGAHTASLGLLFYEGRLFAEHYRGGAFITQHGSWNRNPRSGYKVIFVPFERGRPAGMPETVLDGFLSAEDEAYGRPVGIAMDRTGALLVADDVGNTIWRVTPAGAG